MTPIRRIRRKLEATIAWTPASDSHHVVARLRNARIPPLCVTQAAIRDLEARFANTSPVPFGLLSGALCVTPKTDQEYLLVDEIIPARGAISSSDPLTELAEVLRSLSREATSRGRLVQGWYLGGAEDDLRLDPDASSVHLALFPEPQHVLLLRNAPWGAARGGVFRYEQSTERLFPIPFFELLPERTRAGEPPRSAVRWANYAASEPVQPLEHARLSAPARSAPTEPLGSSAAADPGAVGGDPGPMLVSFPVLPRDTDETSIVPGPAGRLVRVIGAVLVGLLLGVATYVAHGAYAASR